MEHHAAGDAVFPGHVGAVTSGGGGPIVRIDRHHTGQTGWLLLLLASNPGSSGIYKLTPDGRSSAVRVFTPTLISGDRWRLTADGDRLEVFRNGVPQFTYITDGSYAAGDVGIHTSTQAFTFTEWEGGDTAGGTLDTTPPTAPSNLTAEAASSSAINLTWTASTDAVGVTAYLVERCQATCSQVATAAGAGDRRHGAGAEHELQLSGPGEGCRRQYQPLLECGERNDGRGIRPADDHKLRAHDRAGGYRRDDQRHGLHRGHGGHLQREHDELHGELCDDHSGDSAARRHDRATERDDTGGHGDECHELRGKRGCSGVLQFRRRRESAL